MERHRIPLSLCDTPNEADGSMLQIDCMDQVLFKLRVILEQLTIKDVAALNDDTGASGHLA